MEISFLFVVLKVLLGVLILLWIIIGYSLVYRKHRTRHREKIESSFADITSKYLYTLPGEEVNLIEIQRTFRGLGIKRSNPKNVQYLIDLMIRTQRSLMGRNYKQLETLFKQIPPFRASLSKLNSTEWYIKARGIREIYEMGQKQHINALISERNNNNTYVRREAQIAMVVFLGWESLRFLPFLKMEMTLWQQIKVVEKLHDLYPEPDLPLLRKAYESDRFYASELVMRIIRKFRLESEVDYILNFLDHPDHDRREVAIYCIQSFSLINGQQQVFKKKFFRIPNTQQQVNLLKYFHTNSFQIDLEFYKKLLNSGNEILKLSTAEILWDSGYIKIVEEFYYGQYNSETIEENVL